MYSGTCSILAWLARLVAYRPYSRANTYRSASASGAELNNYNQGVSLFSA